MKSSVRGSPDVFQDVPRFLAWGLERTACANKLVNGVETIFVVMRKVIWWRLKKGHFRRGKLRLIVIIFGTSWCLLWDSLNRRWYPQNSLLTRMSQNLARLESSSSSINYWHQCTALHCFKLVGKFHKAVYGYNIFWSKSTKSDKLYGFYCNITQKLYLCEEFKFEKILCHCLPPHHSRLQSTPPTANQHLTMLPTEVINIIMNSYHIHDGPQ